MDDWQLISEYAERGSESAFRELVERHLGLVHSVAMRAVSNPDLAREVSQAVFILLARKASTFRQPVVLSAWLFRTTRFVAARAVRSEARRLRREQESVRMQEFQSPSEAAPHLAPVLDEALGELSESDRRTLLIRFYEDRSLQQVATSLGVREEAAKKRVSRALEKLRKAFSRRGFVVSTAIAGGILSQSLAQAAPAGMAHAISSSALSISTGTTPALVTEVLRPCLKPKVGVAVGVAIVAALWLTRAVWPEGSPSKQDSDLANKTIMGQGAQRSVPRGPNTGGARPFLFRVVDAETGAGIPGVEIHARYWTTREIERNDGLQTDAEGLCEVPLPERPAMRLDLGILAPGYAQKFFSWWPSRFGPLPATYTFKVERGTGIGGRVQDERGKPIENAQIILKFSGVGESSAREPERERFGFWDALPVARTDSAGRWQCANVPPGYSDFGIEVVHDSLPTMTFWVRHDDRSSTGDLELAALHAGNAVLKLQPGYRVAGMVTDEQNRPIAGAKICASYRVNPKEPNAVTGSDGRFEVRNLRKARHAIVVVADGFAPEKVEANLEEGRAEPLAVRLKPGHLLRIRVIDPSGAPVEGADVALERWGGENKLELREPTDARGIFEWGSAPPATLEICVLKPGYGILRNNRLEADGSEHVITIKPEFRVTGRVTDAETGGGIPSFKAVPGYGSQRWDYGDVAYGRDGLYELRFGEQRTPYFVRIMAEGYEIAEAGPFDDEGSPREFDFELRRSSLKSVARGVVLNPDGKPAVHVQVAMCTLERGVMIGRRQIARQSSAKPIETDAEGRFEFAPDKTGHTLVAVGREGCARVAWAADGQPVEMRLQPWGRLEGTVRLGQPSGRRVQLHDDSYARYKGGTSLDMSDFARTSDANGKFVMEEVPPGEFDLFIAPMDGTPYSHRTPVVIKPGETVVAMIGARGFQLRGRFHLPGAQAGINWSNQIGWLHFQTSPKGSQPPRELDPEAIEAWKRNFWTSNEGRALKREQKSIALEVAADGSFFAESVQPGEYELTVHLHSRAVDRKRHGPPDNSTLLGRASNKKISITEEHAQDEVLDLGIVELQSLRADARND